MLTRNLLTNCTSFIAVRICFMLPEFHKVHQQNNELKAILKDKAAINEVTKNDLLKLNKKVIELGL